MTLRDVVIWRQKEVKAMSKYTTGEMAKLCGVSVRTVQYYDNRNILAPSELSEGGRRLYSEDDLRKLKIICFLRNVGLPINSISELLNEEHPENVISIILEQREQLLRDEIAERQNKLQSLEELMKEVKKVERFSVDSIGDIAYKVENKKKMNKLRNKILAVGIVMDVIEWGTFLFGIWKGIWLPFVIGLLIVIILGIWISKYYLARVSYICPNCHKVFRPIVKEAFWARHTPSTRKLTCVECGYKGFCVETYNNDLE